jgi:hypothetical protein
LFLGEGLDQMTINYRTAAGGPGYGVYVEFPEASRARIDAIFHNLDRMLPGLYEALSLSNVDIVYDARNRHKMFSKSLESTGMCCWPLNRIYLGDSGISRGLVHETWHLLDVLAGPLETTLQKSWNKKAGVITFLTYALYPVGLEKPDTGGTGGKILKVVLQAQFTRGNRRGRLLEEKICNGIERAYDQETGWGLGDFLSERFANLLEEWYFYTQISAGVQRPDGVGGGDYFNDELWWGEAWLSGHDEEVKYLFGLAVQKIFSYHQEGLLQTRLGEMRAEHGTGF